MNLDTVNAATMNSYDDTKQFTNMRIQQKTVRFQIDTGATVNVIGKFVGSNQMHNRDYNYQVESVQHHIDL